MTFLEIAQILFAIPTAPYREQWMSRALLEILRSWSDVEVAEDRWGNIVARLRRGETGLAPVAYVAHLDHPGVFVETVDGCRVQARFEGFVTPEFLKGAAVRLFRSPDDAGIRGQISEVGERNWPGRERRIVIEAESPAEGAVLGMFDLEPIRIDGDRLWGRAVDDLGGCAAILAALALARESQEPVDLIAVFTRAEEAGFRGALLLCEEEAEAPRLLPREAWVISVETSSARPHVAVGDGAVLRVGDRRTIFDPGITLAFGQVGEAIAEDLGCRPLVRALMDGGTCEASVFNHAGWRSGGVCLPLGNYHNMNRENGRIEEEYVSLRDAEDVVRMMASVALRSDLRRRAAEEMATEFRELTEDARSKLTI
ncbi:MAG: M20/M25/M40 family metallo-hydrolase [Sumerlaeia bacterium]